MDVFVAVGAELENGFDEGAKADESCEEVGANEEVEGFTLKKL